MDDWGTALVAIGGVIGLLAFAFGCTLLIVWLLVIPCVRLIGGYQLPFWPTVGLIYAAKLLFGSFNSKEKKDS